MRETQNNMRLFVLRHDRALDGSSSVARARVEKPISLLQENQINKETSPMNTTLTRDNYTLSPLSQNQSAPIWRYIIIMLAIVGFAVCATPVWAAHSVTVTAATGGSAISADSAANNTYTTLTGPTLAEGTAGDIAASTIVLQAPTGFVFNTGVTVTVKITAGSATAGNNINNVALNGTYNCTISADGTRITNVISAISAGGGNQNTITYQNIQVRATNGTPLASGNISETGGSFNTLTLSSGTWGALTEVAGAPAKVLFVQQPTTMVVGGTIAPPVTAKITDQFTNTITTSAATVNMSIANNPGSGTLGGTTGAAASSGIATFNSLSINKSGTGYTLSAGSTGLTSGTSSSFNITNGNTTTTLSSGTNPSTYGQSVTFTATVNAVSPAAGTVGGTVTFKDGATALSTTALSGGQATFTTSSLSAATHSITAVYNSDGNFNTSTSSAVSQVVTQTSSTNSVTSSVNPSFSGQSVTLTATITATGTATATGSVTFKDGATTLGTGALSGNQATFSTAALTVASHSITAEYVGDSNVKGSTNSPVFSQTVNKANTTMAVSSSQNTSVSGQSVTFTATVSAVSPGNGTPTGSVTFKDGATTLGTGALSGGQATLSTSALSVASHSITAEYTGNGNFNGSTNSPAFSQTVNKADTTTSVAPSANPSTYKQSVTFTATVSVTSPGSGTLSGTVTFKDGATTLGTGALSAGSATFSTSVLSVGSHSITAVYGGDSSFNGSTSSTLSQTVNTTTQTPSVSSSINPSIVNQSVSFNATVATVSGGATPTGSVQFKIDGSAFGSSVALSGGSAASGSTATLTQGSHTVSAEYSGDGNYSATTNTLTQTVNAPSATCTASNNGPVCSGNTLQLSGTTTDTGSDVYYSWTGPNGFTSTNQNPTISNVTSANAGTYLLTTGKTGTTNCIEMTVVTVVPALTASVSADTVCTGTSGNITANPSGGTAPYSYSWSPGGATTQTISVTDGGVHTVTVTDSTGTGCSVQASGALTLKALPVVAISGANTVCPKSTNTYSAPAGMSSYAWSVSGAASIDGAANAQTVSIVAAAGCNTNLSLTLNVVSNGCANGTSTSVNVIDTTAPSITSIPADATVSCANSVPSANDSAVVASDDCSTLTVTHLADVVTSSNCPNNFVITRSYVATDACGNSSSASQTITVHDTTGPVITAFPTDATYSCSSSVPSADDGSVTASDACGGSVTVTHAADVVTPGSCANRYTIARTYTATDACGNSTSQTQNITVSDETAPVLAGVPADVTVQCNAVPSAASPSATDNCDANPSISFDETTSAGSCPGNYTITRVWTATDSCGNSSSGTQLVTVVDTTVPVLSGVPADATAQCDNIPAAASPTATDNCDSHPTISLAETTAPGSCAGSYVLTRTWTASDACGNHSSGSQHITVIDTTAPTIAGVPSDATVQCDAVPTAATPTATDNCDTNATITLNETRADGSCSNSYTLTRTWTASDACGNTSSSSQTITVIDATAPLISGVPADATVQCDVVPAAANATATDTCDNNPSISFNETRVDGSCANSYTLTRVWTASDVCGNTSTATQTVTVIDTTAPTLAGVPGDATVQCNAVPSPASPTATDTCDSNPSITLNESTTAGACPGEYVLTRTWTASDTCGNTSSATQSIFVVDTTAPLLAGIPADATAQCNAVPSPASPTATDNCDAHPTVSFAETSAAGSCAGSYVLTRVWTASDACGNTSTGSQHITVIDTTAPVLLNVPADATVQCDAVPSAGSPAATDNCDSNPAISFNEIRADGSCAGSFTLTRTWIATDACNNTSSASQTITVIDTTAPVIAGVPANATVQCDAVPSAASPTATDNCDTNATISVVETRTDGSCANSYSLTRTWTASDACGNSSSQSQIVTVVDTTAPLIAGVPSDTTVQCDNVPAAASPTATDNCDSNPTVSFNETRVDGSCANSYTLTRVWTATDVCGNTSTAAQTITVTDTTAPLLAGVPADTTVQCSAIPAAGSPTASDNCDSNPTITFNESIANGSVAGQFVITRTWTASDVCGNISSVTQHVTAVDTTAPTLAGVPADTTVECNAVPAAAAPTASDNCDPHPTVSLNETTTPGSCAANHTITRTWTASDASGNTSSATQTITVHDTTAPSLVGVPVDATVQCDAVPTAPTLTATDNCDTNAVVSLNANSTQTASGSSHYNYAITRTWTATDACGNTSSATQTITVHDTTAPTFTSVPQDTTAECSSVPSAGTPVVADNCDANPTISLNETSTQTGSGCGRFNYTITRTWTATDASGNSSTAQQVVTVHDITVPVLSAAPSDTTVQCDNVPTAATLTATDNCDSAPTVSFNQTRANGSCGGNYVLTRTWTATDACGNTSVKTQTVTVIDNTAPVLSAAPANVTVQCDSIPAAATLSATDNCDSNPTVSMNQTSSQTANGSGHYDYTITRTWTATDACGNHSSASQTITVHDTTAPVLSSVPANTTVACSSIPAAGSPTATDVCDSNPTMTFSEISTQTASGCSHNNYTITRTWTATDVAGNHSSASQLITVTTQAPTITGFPANATYSCAGSVPAANDTLVTGNDACGAAVTITHDADLISAQSCANRYTITRTYHATTACGDVVSRSQTITVNDTTAPTITGFPADATYTDISQVPSANDSSVTATDNCGGGVTISHSADQTIAGSDVHHFTITRTYTATDACGNSASHTQTFTLNTAATVSVAISGSTDARTNKSVWTFRGTASGENPIASVKYTLNDGTLRTASGLANWTAGPLTLVAGTNTFVVYAVDTQNNQSTNAIAYVFWATSNAFKVVVQDWPHKGSTGSAKFTMANIVGNPIGKRIQVGKTYTITEHPGTNRRFLGWAHSTNSSDAVFSTDSELTFVYDTNKTLVARFEDPFYYLKGNYTGLFSETNIDSRSAGYIALNMSTISDGSANKLSSTKIFLDGTKYPVTGATFDTNGHSHFTITSARSGVLNVDLDADLHSSFNGVITGTVSNATWSADVTMYRDNTKDALQALGDARFTFVLPTTNAIGLAPLGWTDGTIHRSPTGNLTVGGLLADSGKTWTAQFGKPSSEGRYPLFAQIYKINGVANPDGILWGWLQFTGDQSGVSGKLYWSRPANLTQPAAGTVATYPHGFTNQADIVASIYNTNAVPLNWTGDGMDFLYDGARPGVTNIMHQIDSFTLKPVTNNVQYPLPLKKNYTLHIARNSGLVTGMFTDPNDAKTPQVSGVVLQNQAMAAGFFWKTNAGAFLLEQP